MPQMVHVRIKAAEAERLREIANFIPGSSINAIVQRAVEQWLEVEGPVYLEAFRQVKETLKRQPVAMKARTPDAEACGVDEYFETGPDGLDGVAASYKRLAGR